MHRVVVPGADGHAVEDGLPDGEYTAWMNQKETKFSLPGPTTVDVR